jgi:hypothetical protein
MDDEQLKAWICMKCGAPLPKPEDDVLSVQCASCGTVFQIPQAEMRSAGVQISGDNIVVHGDIVGGNRIVYVEAQPCKATPDSEVVK